MAKKNKEEVPNPNNVVNRDIVQRLNFLYQASAYLNGVASEQKVLPTSGLPQHVPTATDEQVKGFRKKRRRKESRKVTIADLSQSYVSSMRSCGQKATVKMDPAVKRTLCKGCNSVLVPGSTVSVRIKKSSSHRHVVIYTCIECKTSRRIPAPPTLDLNQPNIPTSQFNSDPLIGDTKMESNGEVDAPREIQASSLGIEKNKQFTPRLPPLFARNIGHIVFCGNKRLPPEEGRGDGIYVS